MVSPTFVSPRTREVMGRAPNARNHEGLQRAGPYLKKYGRSADGEKEIHGQEKPGKTLKRSGKTTGVLFQLSAGLSALLHFSPVLQETGVLTASKQKVVRLHRCDEADLVLYCISCVTSLQTA